MTSQPEIPIDPLLLFQQSGVKVYLKGPDRFRLLNLERLPKNEAISIVDHARQCKPAFITRLTQNPAPCEICPAAGLWAYGVYASKGLICFYAAWFLGRAGSPAPCRSARTVCPLLNPKRKA